MNVPNARGRIPAGGDKIIAAWMPGQRRDTIRMSDQAATISAGGQIPYADRLVLARNGEPLSVGADRDCADGFLMKPQILLEHRMVARSIPVPNRAVIMTGRHEASIRGKCQRRDPAGLGDRGQQPP